MTSYADFLSSKADYGSLSGFEPIEIPDFLFPFQKFLVEWAIRLGRAALFEDCGLGKTPQLFTWADNVVRHTNKPVLVLAPLGVGGQLIREAVKFGFDAEQSRNGMFKKDIVVTNYEKLKCFRPSDFAGCVCDESSILKNSQGKTRDAVIEFMRTLPYRLLCTATAAPNDYPELGNSAEALGYMGYSDMITKFFKQTYQCKHTGWGRLKYHIRGHAERDFWRWVCSWARACRKPSDLGFEDGKFILPGLESREHVIIARTKRDGFLFDLPANSFREQAEERRRTIPERCERVAELLDHDRPAIAWAHLNPEGDLLEKLVKGSIQVSGSDSDERKEAAFLAFVNGDVRVLISKASIAGYGLNFQHCAHQTFFPSHSFEQVYQCLRRSYRFGQESVVRADVVASEGEVGVVANNQRKAEQANHQFSRMIELMDDQLHLKRSNPYNTPEEIPSWLAIT